MKTMKAAQRTLALACAVVVASFAFAGSAFAATVHGADYHGGGSTLGSGEIDVLNVDGQAGETVFLTVSRSGRTIAQNLPYTIGEGAAADDGATWAGIATLDITGLDLGALDGSYAIKVYDNRAGGTLLYSGAIYGVYADLPDGTSKLIGTRTANEAEKAQRSFQPPEALYDGGRTYRLAEDEADAGALHFVYKEYDETTTVNGTITYADAEGKVVATTEIPGLASGEERKVSVPDVVEAENGDLYRTVFFSNSVTAKNPGSTSFKIRCTKISDAAAKLAGQYKATIKMVDAENPGAVIATDSVDVTGNFVYTAPTTIYKKEADTSIGAAAVVTYKIQDSPTIRLSAEADNVENHARTITVKYTRQDPDQPSVEVAFNLVDGSQRESRNRVLGTQTATVSADAPVAVPAAKLDAGGTVYNLVGSPEDYAYEFRSGEVPSVNVYYVPEGYEAPGSYEVTVNYVDYATREVIESHAYTSEPNATGALSIETPEAFTAGDVDYIRVDGQEDAIEHNYYSNIATYVVYYYDKANPPAPGTRVASTRVQYVDGAVTDGGGGATTVTDDGTLVLPADAAGTAAAGADGAAAADGAAGAAGADGADGAAAQNLQLNNGNTYNVLEGEDANGTLTNESGIDTNTERINDSETPLAAGFDRGGSSTAASSLTEMAGLALPVGAGVLAVVIAAAAFVLIRRRKSEADEL